MAELTNVAALQDAFYRLVGTVASDPMLTEQGEAADNVVLLYLTEGIRAAQEWLLQMGYAGWRKRSAALSFSGSDDTGGRFVTLPSDFLRAWGNQRRSALRETNGDAWGHETTSEDDGKRGDFYRIEGGTLWLARLAQPPTTLFLEYHSLHPDLADANTVLDFPIRMRGLIPAEAANLAKEDNWLPGGPDLEGKIARRLHLERQKARRFARQTKQPREFRKPRRVGNRW